MSYRTAAINSPFLYHFVFNVLLPGSVYDYE